MSSQQRPARLFASKHLQNQPDHPHYQHLMRALRAIHSLSAPGGALDREELERQRKSQTLMGTIASPRHDIRWRPFTLCGMSAAWTVPARSPDRAHPVLYIHGGGYTSGNLSYARVLSAKTARFTGYEVLSFEYPLAPEAPYPAALDAAFSVWRRLLQNGFRAGSITVMGDSAGGNLALALLALLKERGMKLPRALVLFSPWTDLTATGRSYRERADADPMLTIEYIRAIAGAYAAGRDLKNPALSPVYGDFAGYPPTLIQVGENEILLSDAVRLRNRMAEAGVRCTLEVWHDMWHVFQMFPMLRARRAMQNVGKFLLSLP